MAASSANNPGEMVRTPRTNFDGRLSQVQAHHPYMNQATLEEEDGVLVNDEVDDYFSPDETYSGEEFELDSNDGLNDYCNNSEDETDDKQFQYINVGNGIRVKTTEKLKEALDYYKTTVWSTADRNKNLKPPSNKRNDKFASNIYKFSTTSTKKAVQNITNADEKKYMKKKQCSFSLVHKHHGKVSFQVPVDESKFPIKDKDINTYWAWVERGTDNWMAIPASLRIQRPDQEYAKQSLNSKTLVASVSDKIRLNYEKSQFKKPIHLFGTLNCNEESGSDFEEFDIKVVGYQDDKPSILDTITEKVTAGRFTGSLEGYDGGALVAIKRGQKENDKFAEMLKNELNLFYGNRKVCKVLLFYISKDNTTLYFKAECCMQGNVADIIAKNKEHKLVFKSLDILLPPHQRIRIRPTGCLGLKPEIKNHPFLFFMYITKENNTLFPVELNRGMGRSTNAIIEFSADNQRRGEITKADFSLDFLSSVNQRPTLSRANSTLSDIFRPQPRSSTNTSGSKNNV
ncbi:uncharacterized protein LOC134705747 [Mytilus trossulus]|uniref:uncharacterized protein LOC134705747 n=1 Tax=Mytilus trossulus TaxID=6551 RepID=UPI00300797D5